MADEPATTDKPAWKPNTTPHPITPAEDPADFAARKPGEPRAGALTDVPADPLAAIEAAAACFPVKGEVKVERHSLGPPAVAKVLPVDGNFEVSDKGEWSEAVASAKDDPDVKAAAQAAHPPAAPSRARKEPGAEPACERYESPRKGGKFVEPATIAEGEERYKAVNDRLKWLRAVRTAQTRSLKISRDKGDSEGTITRRVSDLADVELDIKQARARLVLLDRRIKVLKAAG